MSQKNTRTSKDCLQETDINKAEYSGIIRKRIKGFYYTQTQDGKFVECKIKGNLFKDNLFKNQVAVGDKVIFRKSPNDSVGLIQRIEPRKSFLSRSRVGKTAEQVIAANIDHLLIVCAVEDPPFRINLVFRMLVAARVGNIHPVLVITKSDLVKQERIDEILEPFENFEMDWIVSSLFDPPKKDENFLKLVQGNVTVLSGQSGVGKSSILNKFFPDLHLKTGNVNMRTTKGLHTTTFAEMHELSKGSFVIDTPGIREFGLWDITQKNLHEYFPILEDYQHGCKHRDCRHYKEPGCLVHADLESGEIHAKVYQGYLAILESLPRR